MFRNCKLLTDLIHKLIRHLWIIQPISLITVSKFKMNLHFLQALVQIIIKLTNLNAKQKKA